MTKKTKTIYSVNKMDVTWYVMNNKEIPSNYGVRFFGIEAREVTYYDFGVEK